MSSDTSSENNINYHDTNGKKIMSEVKHIKKESTETDFYFDMVANKEKIVVKSPEHSESSDIKISTSTKRSSSSSDNTSKNSSKSNKSNVQTYNFEQPIYPPTPPKPTFKLPENIGTMPILGGKTLPVMEPTISVATLTPQEVRIKKIELLRRLSEIKTKGYNLTKDYDFTSSIEEMEYEYDLLKSFADKRNGVKLYRSLVLNGISLIEMGNTAYNPFDFKLDGWSEHMSVEIDGWDDVLEELYEKYKTSGGSWPPELKLAMLLVGSGAGYHFTKTNLGGLPAGMGAGAVLGNMMSNKQKPSQFMSAQEVNLEQQKKMMKERDNMMKQKQKDNLMKNVQNTEEQSVNLGNLFNNMLGPKPKNNQENNQPFVSAMNGQFTIPPIASKGNSRDIPDIRAPDNVAEILSRIKNIQSSANINTTETQDENSSNNDRLLSDATLSSTDPIKKRGRKISKAPLINIKT